MIDDLRNRLAEALRSAPEWMTEQLAVARAAMVPAVGAVTGTGPAAPGQSKLGGRPDLPTDLEWPTDDDGGALLGFLCQLNLAEIAPHDSTGQLPARGMLYVFSVVDSDLAYGWDIGPHNAVVRFVADPTGLVARDFPADLDEQYRLAERPLTFATTLVAEESREDASVGRRYDQMRFDVDIERTIGAALVEAGSVDADMLLVKHAYFFRRECAEDSGYRSDTHLELVHLDLTPVTDEFGEGEFHVVIGRKALSEGDLAAAEVVFEPGT